MKTSKYCSIGRMDSVKSLMNVSGLAVGLIKEYERKNS
jgi:hypothetical protein